MTSYLCIAVLLLSISQVVHAIAMHRHARTIRDLWLSTRTRPPP